LIKDDYGNFGLSEYWCYDTTPDAFLAFQSTTVTPQFKGSAINKTKEISCGYKNRAPLTKRHGMLPSAFLGIHFAVWCICNQLSGLLLWQNLNKDGSSSTTVYVNDKLYEQSKTTTDLSPETAGSTGLSRIATSVMAENDECRSVMHRLLIETVLDVMQNFTRAVADRVTMMAEGRILEKDTPEQMFNALPSKSPATL
jgi:hypothetical protein